ncbi:immunoglobulin A1 protease isoform X2 [Pectinophora gossypiella]|uniref:immunoglobulin A1 protease isoform X2 n=1 Tax=Pectinophora gossypiella TaxID=13191 RepID=UPI00214EE7F2|nr:immunoglobulin A1 protease isoform X2 [Pectinophora gossypiella]
MDPRIFVLLAVASHLCGVTSADGPVYGGGQPAAPESPQAPAGNMITQTVYGFLDFTTTIGNTVMVFSPQSAPAPEPPTTEKPVQENIIETKPPPPSVSSVKPEAIKPSKLSDKDKTNKPAVTASSSMSPPKKDEKASNVPKSTAKEQKQIITKVEVVAGPSKIVESPKVSPKVNKQSSQNKKPKTEIKSITNVVASKVEVKQGPPASVIHSKVEIKSSQPDEEPAILITNNNIGEPEYDFLQRQPSEFVEETYKVINIRPSKANGQKPKHKNRVHPPSPPPDDEDHPLGLVTTLGGTIVKDGLTTVHETSVIGTFISGKYAQVLNSNSKVLPAGGHRPKISPSPTHRILKTAAPAVAKNHRHNLEPTPSIGDDDSGFSKTTRRPAGSSFKNRHRPQSNSDNEAHENAPPPQTKKFKNRNSSQRTQSESTTPSFSNRRKSNRNSGHKSTVTPVNNNDSQSRRGFKPRVQATPVEATPASSTSVYKFKLNRAPGSGRWQYKTSPKPKVTIRKMKDDDESTTPNSNPLLDDPQSNELSPQARSDNDLELQGSQSGPGALLENDTDDNSIEKPPPVETLKVEISTPADFKDVYYEIATIKSPYTFQVGRVKNTRIITVTSTIEKRIEPTIVPSAQSSLNEPLTENILATASPYGKDHNLDSSIATLPAITLSSDMETPPLETITETFSTTQNMLKTHILPIVRDVNVTSSLTFIQTYQITRFVTATKTLPPMDFFQFIPSKTLKEFNSRLDEAGSELHLELDFGDSNEDEDGVPRRVFPPDLDLANVGSEFDLTEVDKYRMPENHLRLKKAHGQTKGNQVTEAPNVPTPALTPEQAQQLALLRLLNPAAAAQIPNVVTTSKPILKYETVYESHVIPYFDGKNTVHSTISRPVATVTKTEYEIGTSSLPALPLNPINPLFPPQFTVTSTPVVMNTEVTATDSQILKLTFGAKTVYTTLFTTKVVPTVLTSYVTSSIPVQPSAGFPGYFPAPFAPFPYVG